MSMNLNWTSTALLWPCWQVMMDVSNFERFCSFGVVLWRNLWVLYSLNESSKRVPDLAQKIYRSGWDLPSTHHGLHMLNHSSLQFWLSVLVFTFLFFTYLCDIYDKLHSAGSLILSFSEWFKSYLSSLNGKLSFRKICMLSENKCFSPVAGQKNKSKPKKTKNNQVFWRLNG